MICNLLAVCVLTLNVNSSTSILALLSVTKGDRDDEEDDESMLLTLIK